jgi:hypothetical protein
LAVSYFIAKYGSSINIKAVLGWEDILGDLIGNLSVMDISCYLLTPIGVIVWIIKGITWICISNPFNVLLQSCTTALHLDCTFYGLMRNILKTKIDFFTAV